MVLYYICYITMKGCVMTTTEKVIYMVNNEILPYLNKFNSFAEFDESMPSACTSIEWKRFAYAMASVKWNVEIQNIPR